MNSPPTLHLFQVHDKAKTKTLRKGTPTSQLHHIVMIPLSSVAPLLGLYRKGAGAERMTPGAPQAHDKTTLPTSRGLFYSFPFRLGVGPGPGTV
jgi:hypothetical protein